VPVSYLLFCPDWSAAEKEPAGFSLAHRLFSDASCYGRFMITSTYTIPQHSEQPLHAVFERYCLVTCVSFEMQREYNMELEKGKTV
jgi:hypothetical protein